MTFFDDYRAIPVPFNLLRLPPLILFYVPYHLFREASKFLRGDRKNFARKRFEEHRMLTQEQADRRMKYSQLMQTLIQRSQRPDNRGWFYPLVLLSSKGALFDCSTIRL